jgi:hypothetical protein
MSGSVTFPGASAQQCGRLQFMDVDVRSSARGLVQRLRLDFGAVFDASGITKINAAV